MGASSGRGKPRQELGAPGGDEGAGVLGASPAPISQPRSALLQQIRVSAGLGAGPGDWGLCRQVAPGPEPFLEVV